MIQNFQFLNNALMQSMYPMEVDKLDKQNVTLLFFFFINTFMHVDVHIYTLMQNLVYSIIFCQYFKYICQQRFNVIMFTLES